MNGSLIKPCCCDVDPVSLHVGLVSSDKRSVMHLSESRQPPHPPPLYKLYCTLSGGRG